MSVTTADISSTLSLALTIPIPRHDRRDVFYQLPQNTSVFIDPIKNWFPISTFGDESHLFKTASRIAVIFFIVIAVTASVASVVLTSPLFSIGVVLAIGIGTAQYYNFIVAPLQQYAEEAHVLANIERTITLMPDTDEEMRQKLDIPEEAVISRPAALKLAYYWDERAGVIQEYIIGQANRIAALAQTSFKDAPAELAQALQTVASAQQAQLLARVYVAFYRHLAIHTPEEAPPVPLSTLCIPQHHEETRIFLQGQLPKGSTINLIWMLLKSQPSDNRIRNHWSNDDVLESTYETLGQELFAQKKL